ERGERVIEAAALEIQPRRPERGVQHYGVGTRNGAIDELAASALVDRVREQANVRQPDEQYLMPVVRDEMYAGEGERVGKRWTARVRAEARNRTRGRGERAEIERALEHQGRGRTPVDVDVVRDVRAETPLEVDLTENDRAARSRGWRVPARNEHFCRPGLGL